ncbi:MAG TPA: polysaccharide biosynthesis C-terminal domain-containing protein [Chitinophagaceae bacterium]
MAIRKQAIISSILVYIGFFIGAINTYFFVKNGSFTTAEYGLTRLFFDVAQNFYAFGCLGMIPVIYKFYPYYKDNLAKKDNDLLTWALVTALIGFVLLLVLGLAMEPLIIRKFSARSMLFVQYFHWVFPFSFGLLFFSVIEAWSWALKKTVLSNFLKETALRIITLVFILLYYFGLIGFDSFIKLFSLLYFLVFLILLFYLVSIGEFHITFRLSRVSRKFYRKMFAMQSLVFGGVVVQTIGITIDTLMIASLRGIGLAGVFNLAQYVANLIQIPQRSVQSISTGVISQHWKDKNYAEINRIYKRSSINLLIMALFIYGGIVLNVNDMFLVLPIQQEYKAGIMVMLVMGVARIIDAGTGVNGIIIATSNFWRFDFLSGVIMLAIRIPVTYYLIKTYGIVGSAFAEVFAYGVYNFIRFEFLRRRFNMQPFDRNTVYAILLAALGFGAAWLAGSWISADAWLRIIVQSLVFTLVYLGGVFRMELSPDVMQLYHRWVARRYAGGGRREKIGGRN